MNITKLLKKNISIIIPSAITVLAMLLFIPTVIMRGKISQRLEDSRKLGNEVESAIRSAVPASQTETAKTYEDMHQKDANSIQQLAIQTAQQELLSYKIFPDTNETSMQIFGEFQKAYNHAFAKMVKDMNALDAPTDIEIKKEIGSAKSETQIGRYTNENNEKIVELLCEKRSTQMPIYANPQVFSGYAFWDKWEYRGTEQAVRDCWYCQLNYWIQKDIVDTIININSGSNLVATSSVKRLLGIQFDGRDAIADDTELPSYTTYRSNLYRPWTARSSNEQIDVVHFSLGVIIKADDVLKFMDQLCGQKQHYFSGYKNDQPPQSLKHNQITILQSYIETVDKLDVTHNRYRYGQDTVVYLNLICEYTFNREGYDIIKPDSVKERLTETVVAPQKKKREVFIDTAVNE